ncbi:MAG: FKBP-type peptidyl-prolyl cis-trans isomerase [Candidatus Sulfotelmatobacter sp.]
MPKSMNIAVLLCAAGMLLGNAPAQQTPAATTPPASSSTPAASAPAKSQTSTTGKAHSATTAKTAAPLALKTAKDKFSYAIGMKTGESLKKQSVPVDPSIMARGMRDALAGGKTAMTDEEAQAAITEVQMEVRKKMQEKMQAEGAENKKKGDAFLAENKTKSGVVALPDGLEYKILKEGTGPKPTSNDTVECNYRGTLIDGKEFDSSYKRGKPAQFAVTGVIKGWTEALQLMPVGSKWQLFIPADLAYGERSPSPDIGPNDTLIFEIELLSIVEKNKENPADKK